MTHNQWAEVIRSFLKPCWGYDMCKWPKETEAFIYSFADFLSNRKDKIPHEKPAFEPEYFSGLDWRDALPLVGKVVEFSDDPECYGWISDTLKKIISSGKTRYKRAEHCCYEYIRTTPETHAHPTVTLTVNGKEWVLPRPETKEPEKGTEHYKWMPHGIVPHMWDGDIVEKYWLDSGAIHLTGSRAQAWADFWNEAILGAVKHA